MLAHRYLEQLGFGEKEIAVYLCLAELGKAAAAVVARKCSMPRSTVYAVLEQLEKRGVISVEHERSAAYFSLNPPASLELMVAREREEQENQLNSRASAASELAVLMPSLCKSEHFNVPKLQFFEGKTNVENMLKGQLQSWRESVYRFDSIWWGYQDPSFVAQYRKWLEKVWGSLGENEKACLLTNISEVEHQLADQPRREVKFVPEDSEFSSTIWVLGEYVVVVICRQKPHYAFQLHDSVFAANQRSVFKMLWRAL